MTKTQAKKITKLLATIDIDITPDDILDVESVDQLRDFLQDNDYFNVDIIYYSNAMNYLHENDTSLNESLSIAHEFGYEVQNLNSEVLASLLASQNVVNDFSELEDELEDILK